jgi:hypothetical protein
VLLTRAPLSIATAFDLHVLGTPPAFVLSQNQTLQLNLKKVLNSLCFKFFSKKFSCEFLSENPPKRIQAKSYLF